MRSGGNERRNGGPVARRTHDREIAAVSLDQSLRHQQPQIIHLYVPPGVIDEDTEAIRQIGADFSAKKLR
jgi:hypothetical protein